ncbi:Pex12 amino terminal region-domain-containing protein [Kockovaella imperatae]|uniref:RING-type E3 ubiquitin transferase n=1 Tax=Kockovaella imperatae TaxID=4999 RepID=A0A1Y1UFY9_9TREE|nr:Pex12 amino terminal region-domain-containing protein [Kockovaella imperatae]ORX36426.1 Pex12 amino terminal region-domain-containing protein [Kockovaella imperatae]
MRSEHETPQASGSQILRAQQRDASQIARLVQLTKDLLRSLNGSTWIIHKELIIDALVKAVYLFLTLGCGSPSLGEEYTDIMPIARRARGLSRLRRISAVLMLIIPNLVLEPSTISWLRNSVPQNGWHDLRRSLASVLESPLCQIIPELNIIAFMFSGSFLELGKRFTGIHYVTTAPDTRFPSYEPLGIVLLVNMFLRRLRRRRNLPLEPLTISEDSIHPLADPPKESDPVTEIGDNTYLTARARGIPDRQCSLCFEPRGTTGGTVAVTECGHVFCWECLGGLEKSECPLCRQDLRMERLIAAYNL